MSGPPPKPAQPFDPPAARAGIRITSVYATPWRTTGPGDGQPPAEALRLGRLAAFYATSAHQLPRVLRREAHKPGVVGFSRWQDAESVTGACSWLFALPSGQVVAAVTLDVTCELNRRPTTVGAVGPYVSVLAGHQDYVENTLLLSAVQTVGAAARLREVREVGYRALRSFRATSHGAMSTRQRRQVLGDLAEQLSELEIELSFSVEATADLGLLVPSLRTESFHQALYRSMDMVARAETVARMLQRLERSIAAELTAVESVERRADEQRRLRWAVAIGFLTTVAAPLGLLLSFFGMATSQVMPATSMFDRRYVWVYATLSLIMLTGLLLFLLLYLRERRDALQARLDPRHAGPDRANQRGGAGPPTRTQALPGPRQETVAGPGPATGVVAEPAAGGSSN